MEESKRLSDLKYSCDNIMSYLNKIQSYIDTGEIPYSGPDFLFFYRDLKMEMYTQMENQILDVCAKTIECNAKTAYSEQYYTEECERLLKKKNNLIQIRNDIAKKTDSALDTISEFKKEANRINTYVNDRIYHSGYGDDDY